jgi:hypothetical protein
MVLKYCLIALLSLFLVGFIGGPGGLREELLKHDPGRWGFLNWLKASTTMLVLHIWYCSLLLQPLSWWRLGLAWFVLLGVFGWLSAGIRTSNLPLLWSLVFDVVGIGLGVWVIKHFIV